MKVLPISVRAQRGASMIMVLIMLSVIFVIGALSAQFAIFGERSARNDRDRQIAFQAAEAALLDAELDIMGPNAAAAGVKRVCRFDSKKIIEFVDGCGTGSQAGMCLSIAAPGEAWRVVKGNYTSETGTGGTNKTVQYGEFTGRALPAGLVGTGGGLPVKAPRYTIEAVRYAGTGAANDAVGSTQQEYAFVVTAMGFGFRAETQVMLQALIYKPTDKPGSGC